MSLWLWVIASYLMGAVPTSYLAARIFAGINLREHGSKNLGATNVYRVLGWKYAIPVGVFDVAKGAVPVALFSPLAGPEPWIPVLLGVAAVVGHVYSVFVKFRGGKGVATAAGAVLAMAPAALGVSAVVWIGVLAATGYVSLASMLGAIAFPIAVWFTNPDDSYVFGVGLLLAAFIVVTHRSNIQRLLSGQENRFGKRGRAG
ncbi:MAG: glycerol-3-phosphate 1-O-acyltransferase PlsY [Gemmatimonadota bacterium]|nr:MAG: glycerol-3-phosphate 1-O-acyltransferase PlsY [Gemmatimonadota bacterium]